MRCSCRKPRSARTRLENSSTSSEPVIPRSSAWSSWARLTASSWWWIKVSRKVSRSSRAISRNWVRVPPYSRNQRLVSPARETFSTARQRSAQGLNWGTNRGFRHSRPSDRYPLFCLYRAKNLTVAITSVVLGLLTASARWAPLIAPPRDDHAIDARTVGAKARDFPVHGRFRAYDPPLGAPRIRRAGGRRPTAISRARATAVRRR